MVVRALLLLFVATLMAACAPPLPATPLLAIPRAMPKGEDELRATLATMLARSRRLRITHDPAVKLVSATISGPRVTTPLFSSESHLRYCIETEFAREGWPFPILFEASAAVYGRGTGKMTIKLLNGGCSGAAPEPFKELDDLYRSLKRVTS